MLAFVYLILVPTAVVKYVEILVLVSHFIYYYLFVSVNRKYLKHLTVPCDEVNNEMFP